jgi:hypothetical protein
MMQVPGLKVFTHDNLFMIIFSRCRIQITIKGRRSEKFFKMIQKEEEGEEIPLRNFLRVKLM